METVFIADDEQIIRDGLKQIIDWESFVLRFAETLQTVRKHWPRYLN